MGQRLVDGHQRALLLERFMARKLSDEAQKKISGTFPGKTQKERELHAQRINEIIDNNETEEKVLQKLAELLEQERRKGKMSVMLESFEFLSQEQENKFFECNPFTKRTVYSTLYPFNMLPTKQIKTLDFAPITILYGSNGSGKSTLINIIAEKIGAHRRSPFNGSVMFSHYVKRCESYFTADKPTNIQILTSDDVSEYVLDLRYLNEGLDAKRDQLFEEYMDKSSKNFTLKTMDDYDKFKESQMIRRQSQSAFARSRLMRNPDMFSNGETAIRYLYDTITENGIYLLDEPENSLSATFQLDLAKYIEDSAKHFNCQFIIATHSPFFLSLPGAKIYNLDVAPPTVEFWTDLPNVRAYFDFFMKHKRDFQGGLYEY